MKRTFTNKHYNLLLLWEYEQYDEEEQTNVVLPATPYMIDEAIGDFVTFLEHICDGTFDYDGENVSTDEDVCEMLESIRTQLLDFQAEWKRSFLQSQVHIFFAFFREFGKGDVTIVPKRAKNPLHFTARFGWQSIGLWYLVSYSLCTSCQFFFKF